MKVKVLSRNPDYYLRETRRDLHKGVCQIRLCCCGKIANMLENVLNLNRCGKGRDRYTV
jgi:hypothetical protein